MSYVLTVIHPPVAPAAFGKAVVPEQDPFTSAGSVTRMVIWALGEASATATVGEAREIARGLIDAPGREIKHAGTGLTFRIDDADTPPNACPCCGRLVAPEDAMFAGDKDTTCGGCYPFAREFVGPACLPANTAHTEEPS